MRACRYRRGMSAVAGCVDAIIERALHALSLEDLGGSVEALARGLDASGALLFEYDHAGALRPITGSLLPGLSEYTDAHLSGDPIHPYLRSVRPELAVVPAPPHFDERAFERSAAYADFYHRHDAEQLLGVWPTAQRYGDPGMVGILITRSRRQPRFCRDELRALDVARPALRAAVQRSRRVERVREQRDVAEALLAAQASAVDLVWSRAGRLLWMSPRGRALPDGAASALTERARAWTRSARTPPASRVLANPVRVSPSVAASFFVLSAAPDAPWICATLEPGAAGRATEPPSPAELRVLRLLGAGYSNPQIAERLALSIETVRTHVKQLLRKLDAENRTVAALRARERGLI